MARELFDNRPVTDRPPLGCPGDTGIAWHSGSHSDDSPTSRRPGRALADACPDLPDRGCHEDAIDVGTWRTFRALS